MAKTQLRGWTTNANRRERPAVMIGNSESHFTNDGKKVPYPTMIVTLRMSETGVFRSFRDYCGNPKHPIGWEELDAGIYVVCGLPQDLLELAQGRWWVKDWWWDHDTRVVGGSGHGERPKRAGKTVAQIKECDRNSREAIKELKVRHGQPI